VNYTVLIVCYNEGQHIRQLIEEVRQYTRDILVVDDGSTDGTAEIIRDIGVPALFHRTNHGKGQGVRTGLAEILTGKSEYVLFMDGDGQHAPSDIPQFVAEAQKGIDFICGNRMTHADGMPYKRFFTNRLGSWALSRIINARIPDTMVGYRMLRADLLRKLPLVSRGFTIETEILLRSFDHNIDYSVIPVKTIYHCHGDNKYQGVWDSIRIFFFCGAIEALAKGVIKAQPVALKADSHTDWLFLE